MSIAPNASMLNTLAGTSNYEVPKSGTKLSVFFNEFEMGKSKYGITDWGISNTSNHFLRKKSNCKQHWKKCF